MVKKQKNAAKTLQQNQTDLILLQCLMGGPPAASYIHAQRSTFLLRVDEKCCSWPLSFKKLLTLSPLQPQRLIDPLFIQFYYQVFISSVFTFIYVCFINLKKCAVSFAMNKYSKLIFLYLHCFLGRFLLVDSQAHQKILLVTSIFFIKMRNT